jgi:hypothetical protein
VPKAAALIPGRREMWICRNCSIKHGDKAETCISCGGKKEDVGAVIGLTIGSSQTGKPYLKAKVKPLFAVIFILLVPLLVYLRFSGELKKEDQQQERSQAEQAIVRVNAALNQEERQKEEKEAAGDQSQKADYTKVLIIDSAQIVLKCFSPDEMNEFSSFLKKSHDKTLTDAEINEMETLLASKSARLSGEENRKIKMLVKMVKLLNSRPAKPSKEQKESLVQEVKDLYKNKTPEKEKTDFSRIMQGMGFEGELTLTATRLALKYLTESEMGKLVIMLKKLDSLTQVEKGTMTTLLQKVQEKCGQDEKLIVNAFHKMIEDSL